MNRFSKSAAAWRYAGVHCCMQKVRMLHIIIRPERGRGELRMCTQILRLYVYQATTVRLQYTFLAYSQWYGIHIRIHESTTRTRSDVGTQTAVAGIKGCIVSGWGPAARPGHARSHTHDDTNVQCSGYCTSVPRTLSLYPRAHPDDDRVRLERTAADSSPPPEVRIRRRRSIDRSHAAELYVAYYGGHCACIRSRLDERSGDVETLVVWATLLSMHHQLFSWGCIPEMEVWNLIITLPAQR